MLTRLPEDIEPCNGIVIQRTYGWLAYKNITDVKRNYIYFIPFNFIIS